MRARSAGHGRLLESPDETTAVFVDGALRTGDVGYLDEDGYLFLVDRIKDVISAAATTSIPG